MRKVCQQAAAIGRFPPEKPVREFCIVRRPQQLAGHEIINAGLLVDLRKLPVVSKGIGIPSDLDIGSEVLLEISFTYQNLPHQRFAVRHIQIRFNPHAADHFPSTFFYALANLIEHVGIFLLHPFVGARRRHGELQIGILAHQVQNTLKRIADDLDRFRPGPEPSHVNV